MVTRDTPWPNGTPCWVDLGVDDFPTAQHFYSELFGWDIQPGPPETGGYAICLKNGLPAAGIGPKMTEDQPTVWTTYLASDDLDDTAAKIQAAGGTLLSPVLDVMEFGRMAIAQDPGGAVFGVWQAKQHLGAQIANEEGALIWNENFSRDLEKNKVFYTEVFGYTYSPVSGGMAYSMFKVDGNDAGGISEMPADAPEGTPPFWSLYFVVADTDRTVSLAISIGGTVIRPAEDTPFGRMAVISDSQGAMFAVIAPPAG